MDPIDYEWSQVDLAQMVDDYEAADQQELAEFLDALDEADGI